jgi:chemotaxis signal transduction protein
MTASYFIFDCRGKSFGLPSSVVRETLPTAQPMTLPWMPPFYHGIFQIRGQLLPVIDLASFLGQGKTEPTPTSLVVVCERGNFRFAFRASSLRLAEAETADAPLHPQASLYPALDSELTAGNQPFAAVNFDRLQARLTSALQQAFNPAA